MTEGQFRAFIVNTLRRASFRWKERGECKKKAKVKIGEFSTGRAKYGYQCCVCENVFKSGEVKVDHIEPVVDPIKGFQGYDTYIKRMFCEESGFQVLCPSDHDAKTAIEKDFRVKARALIKAEEDTAELEAEYEIFLEKYKEKKCII